jgi:hypothetical protein
VAPMTRLRAVPPPKPDQTKFELFRHENLRELLL